VSQGANASLCVSCLVCVMHYCVCVWRIIGCVREIRHCVCVCVSLSLSCLACVSCLVCVMHRYASVSCLVCVMHRYASVSLVACVLRHCVRVCVSCLVCVVQHGYDTHTRCGRVV